MPQRREIGLLDLEVGAQAEVSRVSDSDPAILRYLSELGIKPGTAVGLKDRGPFDGPLMLAVEGSPETCVIGPRVAAEIHVVPRAKAEN